MAIPTFLLPLLLLLVLVLSPPRCSAASSTGGIKVIGAGLGRTGTMSLKLMLAELGYKPYHMDTNTHVKLWAQLARAEREGQRVGGDGECR